MEGNPVLPEVCDKLRADPVEEGGELHSVHEDLVGALARPHHQLYRLPCRECPYCAPIIYQKKHKTIEQSQQIVRFLNGKSLKGFN